MKKESFYVVYHACMMLGMKKEVALRVARKYVELVYK